jgi:DNA helicase-2/ATP-dependent DNA helicase PcrA
VVNYPARGIGDTTVNKLIKVAHEENVGIWEVVSNIEAPQYSKELNKGAIGKIRIFQTMVDDFMAKLATMDAYELGAEIVKRSGISQDLYSSTEPEYLSKQENMEEFLTSMHDFVEDAKEEGNPTGMLDFLHEVALLSDREKDAETPEVTLMTIHSAKGLEFPCVYIVGMEENIFPSTLSTDSKRKLEEERRLLYVAITRAERFCVMTYAKMRFRYGKMEFGAPSRFLRDIDRKLINIDGSRVGGGFAERTIVRHAPMPRPAMPTSRPAMRPMVSSPVSQGMRPVRQTMGNAAPVQSAGGLSVGDTVKHDRFGIGRIMELTGAGDSLKAKVEFRNAGTKQLLLKFAKLEKI